MPPAAARGLSWAGRILLLAGILATVTGFFLPAQPAARATVTAGSQATVTASSKVTVRGPQLWNPARGKLFPHRSSVTVDQTADLVNQMIHLSWRGFTPSSGALPYDSASTDYPVMVVECKGLRPTYGQCFGDNNGGVTNTLGTPSNAVYTVTSPDGTGQAEIEIFTALENQTLGCDLHHLCSLAIVPAQGGQPPRRCKDHSQDSAGFAVAQIDFSSPTCSWADRIVVPLSFAPTPINCPLRNANFTVIGSPMMQRAMDQWDAGLCAQAQPLSIQYDSAIPEPTAVLDVRDGLANVALTTRPAPPGPATTRRKFTYAPIAVSAVSIAYWADNPKSGEPQSGIKLDARLVAKMLTTSYNLGGAACTPGETAACDNRIDGNPGSIIRDPEFMKLNRRIVPPQNAGSVDEAPIVQSGHSDMTYEVTRWISSDPAARSFMAGTFDPWGMHVDTAYLGLRYPTDAFIPQDPFPAIAHAYSPLFPLSTVASDMVQNFPPVTSTIIDPITGNYDRLQAEALGTRALFAIVDQADAAAFQFPVAALRNPAGRYVEPTTAAMTAAVQSMRTNKKNGITQQVNLRSRNRLGYPLTMVIYAMVPTSHLSARKAASIAEWLSFAAGPGQVQGTAPGELPAGYLPLPPALRNETLRAAAAVLHQTGNKKIATATPTPAPSSPIALPTVTPRITLESIPSSRGTGISAYALPAVIIGGTLALLAGASSMLASTSGAVVVRLRRLYAAGVTRRRRQP